MVDENALTKLDLPYPNPWKFPLYRPFVNLEGKGYTMSKSQRKKQSSKRRNWSPGLKGAAMTDILRLCVGQKVILRVADGFFDTLSDTIIFACVLSEVYVENYYDGNWYFDQLFADVKEIENLSTSVPESTFSQLNQIFEILGNGLFRLNCNSIVMGWKVS